MKALRWILLAGVFVSPIPGASADVLLIDAISAGAATGVQSPGRGMTMDQVRQRFGEPLRQYPAVGDPPISRWDYSDFSVYFERQLSLHSVVRR